MLKGFSLKKPFALNILTKINKSFTAPKGQKYKVIQTPSQSSKLIFDQNGLCKIYEFKGGQYNLRKIVRYIVIITFINGLLFGLEMSNPIFGKANMFSFGLVTGLGYFLLAGVQVISRRSVNKIHLSKDFQTVHLQFFNAFWVFIILCKKPSTYQFNISEFQEPIPGFADFTRFQLTRIGKIWINLPKNEFTNVVDYEDTLNHLLLGKPLTNLNIINLKKKSHGQL